MSISVKNAFVVSCKFPLFICHSHWSPCFERTTICNISVIICINACQQIFIHCDISCQNYVRLQILRGSVCQCSVYKPGKPVKLPCISDFVGFVTVRYFAVGIYIIFAGCKYCRLVCVTAVVCAETIFICVCSVRGFCVRICCFCIQIYVLCFPVLCSTVFYFWLTCFLCFYYSRSRFPCNSILTDCQHCFFCIYVCHICRGKHKHCCHSCCDHFPDLSADCSVSTLFHHFFPFTHFRRFCQTPYFFP